MQGARALAANEGVHAFRRIGRDGRAQLVRHRACRDERTGGFFVVLGADLLERVGEGMVSDVVEQRGGDDDGTLRGVDDAVELAAVAQDGDRATREVIRA